MISEKTYFTGTITLNYAEIPNAGKPLAVVLHGGSARWQAVESVMRDLAADYHVIAPDLRGHGRSNHIPNGYRMVDFADDIERFVGHLDRLVILIGHSLGGQIALMVAARVPEAVRALIIGDAPLAREGLRQLFVRDEAMLRGWMALAGREAAQIVDALKDTLVIWGDDPAPRPAREAFGDESPWFAYMAENLAQHDPTMLSMRLEQFDDTHEGFDMDALLPKISAPTLLLQADPGHGGLMSNAEVAHAMQGLPRPYHVKLAGIGHGLFVEDHAAIMRAIRAFLADVLDA